MQHQSNDDLNRNERLSSYDTDELRKEIQRVIDGDTKIETTNNDVINYKKLKDVKDLPDEQDRKRIIVSCTCKIMS